MAKENKGRSARLLAFILALIMVASVLAYSFRNPSKPELREVKFDMGEDWRSWLEYIPNTTGYVVYFDYTEENDTLRSYIYNRTAHYIYNVSQNPYLFRDFRPSIAFFSRMMITDLYNCLIDVNRSKVYFAYKHKDTYKNFTMKVGRVVRWLYAMVDEVHPVILANPLYAMKIIDLMDNGTDCFLKDYGKYTSRINGSFSYTFLLAGESAKRALTDNGTPIADFYFEGYRMNGSIYEKVVGMHFIGYYYFVKTNETLNRTTYYYYKNYDDRFSLAIMGSKNFTELTRLTPEIRTIIVKFNQTET